MPSRARKSNCAKARALLREAMASLFARLNASIVYLRGAPAFGLVGAGLFAYFQYLSNYENKLRDVSKDDLAQATSVFIDISDKLASAMTLQEMLYFTFSATKGKKPEQASLQIRTAPELYKSYSAARTELRQNIAVYARRAEIFIDWPSDLDRDPAQEKMLPMDPITKSGIVEQQVQQEAQQEAQQKTQQKTDTTNQTASAVDIVNLIGAYNFDCDEMFPVSRKLSYLGELTLPRPETLAKNTGLPDQIVVNWGSLKHQLVTFQYCFERIHDKLEPAREWASSIGTERVVVPDFADRELIHQKLDDQVARFNYFIALAMRRIEDIRVKYRPNGFWCYVPGIREIADKLKEYKFIEKGCSPIHYASPSDNVSS